MLSLDSQRWAELRHAYGDAADIPGLLRQLDDLPPGGDKSEPWFSLWSALAHQDDVYSASFAAVPYVVNAVTRDPGGVGSDYFGFPAWVEICRKKARLEVPPDLEEDYFSALAELPGLAGRAAVRDWEPEFVRSVLAAIAVAKGEVVLAEVLLELDSEVAAECLEWLYQR